MTFNFSDSHLVKAERGTENTFINFDERWAIPFFIQKHKLRPQFKKCIFDLKLPYIKHMKKIFLA